jgi:hypothetical protein
MLALRANHTELKHEDFVQVRRTLQHDPLRFACCAALASPPC